MKCPYCNSDMKLGQIEADNLLSWKPDGEKSIGGTRWAKSSNSIVLAKYYMFTPASVDAFTAIVVKDYYRSAGINFNLTLKTQ